MDAVIAPIDPLNPAELQTLLDESLSEGYRFVQTLLDEYVSGANCFDVPGAALFGVYQGGRMIGIGGVHPDPYLKRTDVGRIRHVYVLNEWRRHGVGRLLLDALIDHARDHFTLLTLRTNTDAAARFYEAIGFSTQAPPPEATHWLTLVSP